MSESDHVVLRAAPDLPEGFMPPGMDGRWYDRALVPGGPPPGASLPEGVSQAVAVATGRFEVRDYDGAVAEVFEIRP